MTRPIPTNREVDMSEQSAARQHDGCIAVVFDGPPDHDAPHFVEVEDASGASIRVGEWEESSDGYWRLWMADPRGVPA